MEPATKTLTLDEMLNDVRQRPEVLKASKWERGSVGRIYVTMRRSVLRHSGDTDFKVYWDAATGWNLQPGRGPRSDAFKTNLKSFVKHFCPELIHLT
jgi:hypothetical protein